MGPITAHTIRRLSRVGFGVLLATTVWAVGVGPGTASARTPGARAQETKAAASSGRQGVLYVGTFDGISTPPAATFTTIQDAVDAAKAGDWILIAPGDYHEQGDMGANAPTPADLADGWYGSVDISTPNIHLRGMDRNSVIVDGTKATATSCSPAAADQNTLGGQGRNGIVIWKANNVSVDNLTVCNFLAGSGDAGNGVWWNGDAGSGSRLNGLIRYSGSYLTATSTYFHNSDPSHINVCGTCAMYGIFSSASGGPSTLTQIYANNFADSGVYVGACRRGCNVTIDHAWMENSALGYSGTNSGGAIVVQNSRFDANKDGFDTNTALTGDPPPPQNGRCWAKTSPITGTGRCWVLTGNLFDNNNNPDVPIAGTAGLGPTGTGMTVSGGRYDTITGNEFLDNGAWGIAFVPYPDGNTESDGRSCTGTRGFVATSLGIAGLSCIFDPQGNALVDNKFSGNGSFGNPTNADYANLLIAGGQPVNCFVGNTEWDSTFTHQTGPATSGNPAQTSAPCGTKTPKAGLLGSNTDLGLLQQLECDSGLLSGSLCSGANYPQPTAVVMHPLPSLPSMPNPCAGAPTNLWCPGGNPVAAPKG